MAAGPDALMPMSPLAYRRTVIVFQSLKFGAFLLGLFLLATGRVSWLDGALFAGMYVVTMLGITMGFHRLFAHRSFEPHPALRYALAAAGAMAAQGSVLVWAAAHRKHHQHSDQEGDPHSPHAAPGGALSRFWHAHTGWILNYYPAGLERYIPDLMADPIAMEVHRRAGAWILIGLAAPALVGGLVTMSWQGALTGMLWGGWVRMFLVEQGACFVNSLGHMWGRRPYASRDRSTNSWVLAVMTLGDGWHNGHHAFPASARHGLGRWEIDPTYLLIRLCEKVGLAKQVVVPAQAVIAAKHIDTREAA